MNGKIRLVFMTLSFLNITPIPSRRSYLFLSQRHTCFKTQGRVLAIDATYKVVTDGFPLIIAGMLDSNGKFDHFGLAVIQSDEKEEVQFILSSWEKSTVTPGRTDRRHYTF
jgi:hypothetical protein